MTDRFAAIRNKTQEVLARAQELYGVDIKPTVSFNLRGRTAGWAGCKFCRVTLRHTYTLRFNQDLVAGDHFDDMINETVPHEVAHLVCYARPDLGRKHDAGWRRVCMALGGNGNTRHDYAVTYAHGGFTYRATCGTEITVSSIIHSRIQAGQQRVLRRTGGRVNSTCAWAPAGRPLPAAAPVKPVAAPVSQRAPSPVADSRVQIIIKWIKEARARGDQAAAVSHRLANVYGITRSQADQIVSKIWLTGT